MEVIIQPDAQAASALAAQRIATVIRQKPSATLGLATGSSPLALYAELIRMHREEDLDFQHVTTFNLDEYLGLSPSHPSSYNAFMWENLFRHINVNPARVFVPSGKVDYCDLGKYCARYEEEIRKAGGIDLQVLGIGGNGHIGFNEPGSSLASRTRIKTLAPQTVEDNRRYFDAHHAVPLHVITMGIGTILEAGELCLLGFGEKKAQAAAAAVEGPLSAFVPASALQLHRKASVYLDEPAAAHLKHSEYYRWVFRNKPPEV
ncbi:glucosamine-6-phosphate deaminase [Terrimicrobium sacchariphilum]|uniref:Glucosamine-6-phosphate deaminase n=1 Tax=Terrimicrobium sacchariphilum TaxID=690879 RepID=A0A146G481_TERSA|nr:glucosamine-6-phosphate deaminase [Terrimicrobium sacchariphilum]GAT32605.1 glucosamine-6-phosphate deaminase [Terrimicrobium sacchariphilum]